MQRHRQLTDGVAMAIRSFEQLVVLDASTDIAAVSRSRLMLARSVNAYLAHLGACVAAAPATTRNHPWKDEYGRLVDLRLRYSAHIARFGVATVSSDWPGYRSSCERLIAAMRRHLDEVATWGPIG